jgi:hypothetical protein
MASYTPSECDTKSIAVILVKEGLQRCPKRYTQLLYMCFFRNKAHVRTVHQSRHMLSFLWFILWRYRADGKRSSERWIWRKPSQNIEGAIPALAGETEESHEESQSRQPVLPNEIPNRHPPPPRSNTSLERCHCTRLPGRPLAVQVLYPCVKFVVPI